VNDVSPSVSNSTALPGNSATAADWERYYAEKAKLDQQRKDAEQALRDQYARNQNQQGSQIIVGQTVRIIRTVKMLHKIKMVLRTITVTILRPRTFNRRAVDRRCHAW